MSDIEIEPMETTPVAHDGQAKILAPHMVPSSRPKRAEERYPVFTGEKDSVPLNEFLDRFKSLARADDLSDDQRADKLLACCSRGAFSVLRKVITDCISPLQRIALYEKELTKSFGVSPEKAFSTLCKRGFNPEKDDIDGYANDINAHVDTAFEGWSAGRRDEIATKFFWHGLPQSLVTRQLYAMYRNTHVTGQKLTAAVDLCRGSYEMDEQPVFTTLTEQTRDTYPNYKGKGVKRKGKGKGKGKGVHRNIQTSAYRRCRCLPQEKTQMYIDGMTTLS
jgi:hypothetical protein